MATAAGTTPEFVAAIDFGTTECSVAYRLRPDLAPNRDPTILPLNSHRDRRVASCILFDPSGKKIAFGYEAREQFAALDNEERPEYHYFEFVKKNLQYEKVNIVNYTAPCPINAACDSGGTLCGKFRIAKQEL